MKKTLAPLLLFALLAATVYTAALVYAHSTVDQENLPSGPAANVKQLSPIGQEFKPAVSSLGAVDVFVGSSGTPRPTLTLNVRESTISGDIIASSSQVVPLGSPEALHFDFPPVAVTPENTYVIELVADTFQSVWAVNLVDTYARGRAIANVGGGPTPFPTRDFAFRTYANTGPSVTNPGDQTSDVGDAATLAIVASDPDGDTRSYSAVGLPPDLSIDAATGVISGTVAATAGGDHSVTITASDGSLAGSAGFTWTVNRAPTVTNPGDQTSEVGDAVSLAINASDPDDDALSYSEVGLPPDLSIDATTGVISGTVAATADGDYSVSVTASDGSLTGSASFTWTVNRAPTVTNPGDQASDVGDAVTLSIVASDPDIDPLSYTAAGLPPDLVIDGTTGVISGTVAATAGGDHSVTITASDGSLTGSAGFTWTVNRAPTVTNPGDQTSELGDAVSLAINASDPDGDTRSYSAVGLPPDLSIDAATGVISGTVAATADGDYSVTVTASDGSLTGSASFTWTVSEPASEEPTPRELKLGVIEDLLDHVGESKRFEKAIKKIEKNLDPKRWVDDSHLDPKHGRKVFKDERKAVKHLMRIVKKGEVTAGTLEAAGLAIGDLAETLLIETLGAEAVDPKRQEKVDKEMAKAEADMIKGDANLEAGNFDKAIKSYGKAWEHASKASKEAAKPAAGDGDDGEDEAEDDD